MVSRDLKRIKRHLKVAGTVLNIGTNYGRLYKEKDEKRQLSAVEVRKRIKKETLERAQLLEAKMLKVGDRVTDGKITGKISSIDKRKNVIEVDIGTRIIRVIPTFFNLV